MGQPLSNIRILDLTHVLAGPYATGQLGLMGAEVIRVERPGGDDFVRRHGGTKQMQDAGLGASFLSQNSGKKSIVLDLKSQEDRKENEHVENHRCDHLQQPCGIENSYEGSAAVRNQLRFFLKVDRRQSYGCCKADVKQV